MNMLFKAFAGKLFGTGYGRLRRTLLIDLLLFWGLFTAGFKVQIAPRILYLMISTFTAGVMWQSLSSEDNAVCLPNLLMLPFSHPDFICSYTAALGAYVFLTKTATLLAVLFAVSDNTPVEAVCSILCALNALLMTSAVFPRRHALPAGCLWGAALIAAMLFLGNTPRFWLLAAGNAAAAFLLLHRADPYAFYTVVFSGSGCRKSTQSRSNHLNLPRCLPLALAAKCALWRYLFRYLLLHRNYLLNTAILWGIACVLPFFLGTQEGVFVIPLGLALLTINTPVCILLSVDPALEQAVRFLPGQKKAFCVPYCLFIFLCNLTADCLFLGSWQLQIGGITFLAILTALYFALQSAVFSVLLEWFCPLRNWKIESDLWHHPRKYAVPAAMLLLAGVVGTLPALLYALLALLVLEIVTLFTLCRKG